MVGYDPDKEHLSESEHMAAGACSGMVTRAISQPLDVLKVRFQFGVFEVLTKYACLTMPGLCSKDIRPITHFACGALAGGTATLAAHPFDVIRTRLIAQGKPKVYKSILHASRCMWHQDGLPGFYRGLLPTLLQITPQTGFQFGFYSLFSIMWSKLRGTQTTEVGAVQSLLCGSAAGTCAKVVVYPLDLVKKRLQVVGFEKGRHSFGKTVQYTGFVDCLQRVACNEGLRGLYKGLSPSVIKAAVTAGCHFCVYEQCCSFLIRCHHRT